MSMASPSSTSIRAMEYIRGGQGLTYELGPAEIKLMGQVVLAVPGPDAMSRLQSMQEYFGSIETSDTSLSLQQMFTEPS